ncbi:hypothetical protein UFOVP1528_20 [uncultured Caudovirales phage]|uniref:Uncharacterized protein n=1 Tax=uncultured Caudovirales phage TaxID=2100421 RepID=A0A6J5SF91_9CAUD|nr:hypothetical protein UFOVP905_7 [uncultured Caudovirales phage]CAB4183209.1 hypothetical protein UFOVP1080_43 [uncultured Caudovirales phage]CAB4197613.1 hypothetical protein UFOVP1321_31 [uncultured Caudovirales phage]CAB4212683.1 hypothetical protein UFOVP1432_32 [uncultured Caudovirales phage]CAB5227262.1 hypothetical protein UFOVP1528_20 [uncultured Caudovirales phage]
MSNSGSTFIHVRVRNNGIASDKGGYTVAIKGRVDGKYSVSICQCNTNQRYDGKLGEKIADMRINRGQFFVQSREQLDTTLNTLNQKLCTGNVLRLDTSVLDTHKEAA